MDNIRRNLRDSIRFFSKVFILENGDGGFS